jgi:hypothetical protein
MYYRLGKFEDVRRSATRAMKWAKDFRMDAPWSQRGENTNNLWSDAGEHHVGGISLMIDNFAIPAATIRGLFDYEYRADRLILRPRIPGSITYYAQKQPVRFGDKRIYLSCRNGGSAVKSVTVNGTAMDISTTEEVVLMYSELPVNANIDITTEGGWPAESSTTDYPKVPALISGGGTQSQGPPELPDSLRKAYNILISMNKLLASEPDAEFERAFVAAAIKAFEDCRTRATMDPGPGYYRPISEERKGNILKFYEQAALGMYNGFAKRAAGYGVTKDARQKHLAALFDEAQR